MPKKMHDALAREARKKGLRGAEFNAYVYGTLARYERRKKKRKKRT